MSTCTTDIDYFCFACGKFTPKQSKRKITADIAEKYEKYFGMTVIQNVSWAPSSICTTCSNDLRDWCKGNRESMSYGVPTIWNEPVGPTGFLLQCR